MTHVSKIDVLVLIRLQVWSFNKCFLVVIVGHENTGVVGGTVSAMALLYCRSVKLLSTIPDVQKLVLSIAPYWYTSLGES